MMQLLRRTWSSAFIPSLGEQFTGAAFKALLGLRWSLVGVAEQELDTASLTLTSQHGQADGLKIFFIMLSGDKTERRQERR